MKPPRTRKSSLKFVLRACQDNSQRKYFVSIERSGHIIAITSCSMSKPACYTLMDNLIRTIAKRNYYVEDKCDETPKRHSHDDLHPVALSYEHFKATAGIPTPGDQPLAQISQATLPELQ